MEERSYLAGPGGPRSCVMDFTEGHPESESKIECGAKAIYVAATLFALGQILKGVATHTLLSFEEN